MEEAGIIQGSSLTLNYTKLGYSFIAYVGIFLQNTSQTKFVLERINEIPFAETMISLEESINDKKRLMHSIFNEMN